MNDKRFRIERALKVAAHYVNEGGPVYLPIFERLERELAALETTASALDRARKMAGRR